MLSLQHIGRANQSSVLDVVRGSTQTGIRAEKSHIQGHFPSEHQDGISTAAEKRRQVKAL